MPSRALSVARFRRATRSAWRLPPDELSVNWPLVGKSVSQPFTDGLTVPFPGLLDPHGSTKQRGPRDNTLLRDQTLSLHDVRELLTRVVWLRAGFASLLCEIAPRWHLLAVEAVEMVSSMLGELAPDIILGAPLTDRVSRVRLAHGAWVAAVPVPLIGAEGNPSSDAEEEPRPRGESGPQHALSAARAIRVTATLRADGDLATSQCDLVGCCKVRR